MRTNTCGARNRRREAKTTWPDGEFCVPCAQKHDGNIMKDTLFSDINQWTPDFVDVQDTQITHVVCATTKTLTTKDKERSTHKLTPEHLRKE